MSGIIVVLSMQKFFFILLIVSLFSPTVLNANMSGGNYEIYADSIGVSEAHVASGGDFGLFGTGGESFATSTAGGAYVLRGGFQALEKGILEMALDANTVNFGTLNTISVTERDLVLTVGTDSHTGYSVTVSEDGNLRDGSDDINDVVDGAVTAGSEEYGIATDDGGDGLLTQDEAITNGLAVAATNGEVNNRTTTITLKAAVSPSTVDGSYSHDLTFTITVNP